ncbi:MAG TPA: tetratricopeptide repeat protein [Thermoanaerobaculia bacterium]|jgi:tetratricopeptide (TPR) repeat protein|nr:tetratricopeptide repeat protein [Thermoanaerobaculia bacterium]
MTDWLSATAMILSGGIVGFMFWYGMKGRAAKPDLERLDLEAKRDTLLQQLRELKETGGSADEQRRLEHETAAVLRALDKRAPDKRAKDKRGADSSVRPSDDDTRPELDPRALAAHARASSIRGFVWGVAAVAVLGGIAWFVTQQATPKTAGTTGGTPMASATQSSPQQQPDAALQQIQAAVASKPDDLEARNQLAKAYLERENLMAVFQETQYILKRSPNDARALTYQALVRMSMGQRDGAEEMLHRAIKSDPELLDAYVALAWDYVQSGKTSEAEGLINEAARRHPDQEARLEEVFAKMKEQARSQPPPAAMPADHPALPVPGAESPAVGSASVPAATSAGPSVHLTLSLAGSVKQSPSAVLFIIVRAAGESAGPPAAAKRIDAPKFPLELDITSADSMMGQPLPLSVTVEARLDSDGNAMTKDPSDPHASQSGVATNGTKVALVLK